jgi:DNA-directed RNA polymerase beta subunit
MERGCDDDGSGMCNRCGESWPAKTARLITFADLAEFDIPVARTRVVMPYGSGYLMERMNNPKYPATLGRMRLPGGGIEPGETPQQAAVREMQEELGVTLDPSKLRSLGIYAEADHGPEEYFQLDAHDVKPGNYTATVGGDKNIELLEGNMDADNYWGAKLDALKQRRDPDGISTQPVDLAMKTAAAFDRNAAAAALRKRLAKLPRKIKDGDMDIDCIDGAWVNPEHTKAFLSVSDGCDEGTRTAWIDELLEVTGEGEGTEKPTTVDWDYEAGGPNGWIKVANLPTIGAPQPALPPLGTPAPLSPLPKMRATDDPIALRTSVYEAVKNAASTMQPVQGPTHTLRVIDVDYDKDDPDFTKADEKRALLERGSLNRRLKGTWELLDNATGQVVSTKRTTLANVPAILHNGTFISRGTRYAMGYQQRLRPGVYTRKKNNGQVENHVNVASQHGSSHRYVLSPETGQFHLEIGHAKIPLMPLLETLGASRDEIKEAWGEELFEKNIDKVDSRSVNKLYERLVPKRKRQPEDENDPQMKRQRIREAFDDMIVDPEVVEHTLGKSTDRIDYDTILRATKEVLKLSRGERDQDDRDHLAFATFHSAPDIFAERFLKDYGGLRRELLRKVARRGNLDNLPASVLDKQIDAALFKSGLGQTVEDTNPLETLMAITRVTRFGEGGLPDTQSAPSESREVGVGQFGFVDLVTTPESLRVGVDGYLARNTFIGEDNKLYTKVRDQKGQEQIVSPGQLLKSSLSVGRASIPGFDLVVNKGKMQLRPQGSAEYNILDGEALFGHGAGVTPLKSAMYPQRTSMASRMGAQALSVENAEAPLVQTGVPGTEYDSYEARNGERFGAERAKLPGRVMAVGDDFIEVKYQGGETKRISLDRNRPGARKSLFHQDPVVTPGQEFEAGALLAISNYTDKEGVQALGLNARTALMSLEDNWEDGIVVSESFAKRMKLQQAYKHGFDVTDGDQIDKRQYLTRFGTTYKPEQLQNIGDDGVIKPGTVVKPGDPLILGVRKKLSTGDRVHSQGKSNWGDASVKWDHNHEGIVTDIAMTPKGAQVIVRTTKGLEDGDKLCYDQYTEVLTGRGWLPFPQVTTADAVCILHGGEILFQQPVQLIRSRNTKAMFHVQSDDIDLMITANHRCFARRADKDRFKLVLASELQYGDYVMVRPDDKLSDPMAVEINITPDIVRRVPVAESNTVYCLTVSSGVFLVRRNGKVCWSGNSGRAGNKGTVTVWPDAHMPYDTEGRPIEVAISPMAVPSRGNSSFPIEMLLGKVARARGRAYRVNDFEDRDAWKFAVDEATKHGISETEELTDPRTGRKVPNVLTGELFTMALSHIAESKQSARGLGRYNAENLPARGPQEGANSKRFSGQQLYAALSHGAYDLSRETTLLRGTRNDDYWATFMSGGQTAEPRIPEQYEGFIQRLQASGINPVRRGSKTQLMAMTDKDVDKLSGGRVVTTADTVDMYKDLSPIKGGLFDPRIFGDGDKFGQINLAEPTVNPVFEEPIRRLLGVTEKQFRSILGGREEIRGFGSGPEAIHKRLSAMNLDQEIAAARREIAGTKKTARDAAIRRLTYLKGLRKTGLSPTDMLITKVPVLPTRFRPIAKMQGRGNVMVNDANFLYKELMLANEALGGLRGQVDDLHDERLALYDAQRALVGITDPASQELKQRKVKGLLKVVLGKSSPKSGMMMRKLLSGNVDTIGRGVIMVDSNLDMDSIGIPESMAFTIYEPYVIRNLVQRGIPRIRAAEMLKNKDDVARQELMREMKRRPVTASRAPILHKYGDMALWPQLVKGDAIRFNPAITPPMGADFDGDAVNISVPHSVRSVGEAINRMMPSKMLTSESDFKSPVFKPGQDHLMGLYQASVANDNKKQTRYFATLGDAMAAMERGEIDASTPVRIAKKSS